MDDFIAILKNKDAFSFSIMDAYLVERDSIFS